MIDDHGLSLFPTMARLVDSPDVTIVTYSGMLPVVEQIAEELTAEELAVEIVVPGLVNPLPLHQLRRHLADRPAVVIVERGIRKRGSVRRSARRCSKPGSRAGSRGCRRRRCRSPAARSLETGILPGPLAHPRVHPADA